MRVIGQRAWIKAQEVDTVSKSGIILEDAAKKKNPTRGEIIFLGKVKQDIKVGDTVIFENKWNKIEHEGQEYMEMHEDNITAVIG